MRTALSRGILAASLILSGVGVAAAARPALQLTATQQADSVQVIAKWANRCDWRGCADSVRVQWTVAGRVVATRFTRRTVDTLKLVAPAWGDSVAVSAGLTSYRRRTSSVVASASTVVRRLDAPPPPPDSLRLDTLALRIELEEIARADSFPLLVIRPADGRTAQPYVLLLGTGSQLCALARNRYTGFVTIVAEWETTDADLDRIAAECESARRRYEAERGG